MNYPVLTLDACERADLPKHSKIWATDELQPRVNVYLTPDIVRGFSTYQIDEITDGSVAEIPAADSFKQDRNWIDIDTSNLNISPGYHLYRLSLINTSTQDIIYLYFAYTIQDSNPDKSYVYMKENCKCTNCPACSGTVYEQR